MNNKKKRKPMIPAAIIVVVILIAFMLFPIQEMAITILGKTRNIPQAVKDFPLIQKTKDTRFKVTTLNRNEDVYTNEYNLFKKENGDYIIELREHGIGDNFQIHYYCVAPNGSIKDTLKLPDQLFFRRGYIVGKGTYCNWTTTGDTTIYNATPIKGELSKDEFQTYYDRAEAVCAFSKDVMLLIEGKWHIARLNFWLTQAFEQKGKILSGDDPTRPEYFFPTYKDLYPTYLFSEVPHTAGELEFCFFEKDHYRKEKKAKASFNPTGGNSWAKAWIGIGYFKLKFPQSEFCFKHSVDKEAYKDNWKYELPFDIYKTDAFAIINTQHQVYLVQSNP